MEHSHNEDEANHHHQPSPIVPFPYVHASHPVSLAEGTGLHYSPFPPSRPIPQYSAIIPFVHFYEQHSVNAPHTPQPGNTLAHGASLIDSTTLPLVINNINNSIGRFSPNDHISHQQTINSQHTNNVNKNFVDTTNDPRPHMESIRNPSPTTNHKNLQQRDTVRQNPTPTDILHHTTTRAPITTAYDPAKHITMQPVSITKPPISQQYLTNSSTPTTNTLVSLTTPDMKFIQPTNVSSSFSTPVQNIPQTPVSWLSPPLHNNTSIYPPHHPNSFGQPQSNLSYRQQSYSSGIPTQLYPTTTIPHPDGYAAIPSTSLSAPLLPRSNPVSTTAPQKQPLQDFGAPYIDSTPNFNPPLEAPPRTHAVLHRVPQFGQTSTTTHPFETHSFVGHHNPFTRSPYDIADDIRYNSLHNMSSIPPECPQPRNTSLPQTIPNPHPQNLPKTDECAAALNEHPHQASASCQHCNKIFKTEKDKQRHVQRMHLKRGRFPCPHSPCSQSFAEAHKLNRHIRTVHLLNRPFKCPQCDSAFGERGNMMQHMRKAHLGQGRGVKRVRRN